MKKLNKVAMLFACAALVTGAGAQSVDNWRNGTTESVWMNGTNELCWRDATWTAATASSVCDGAIKPVPVAAAPVAEPAAAPAAPAPVPPPPPPPPAATKVTYAADAHFDFDKSVVKPADKAKMDDLVSKVKDIDLEVVIAVGHTDAIGKDDYNQKLSVRRANAVKDYLASKGIEPSRIYTEGKGESQPVADNKSRQGRAQNRRVEIEAVGTRAAAK